MTGNQPLPAGTVNPAFYNTPSGAVGLRTQALYTLEQALPTYLIHSGVLTDELESNTTGINPGQATQIRLADYPAARIDARLLPEIAYGGATGPADQDYTNLQSIRNTIIQALAAIAVYDTGAKAVGDPRHLRAELFALQGYTEILLADLFCSGVPLSTLDFNSDYTYRASSTTAQVYQDAIIQEDSVLALGDTSTRIQYLARVLKGRALLALNDAAGAAQAVAPVPDDFQYRLAVDFHVEGSDPQTNLLNLSTTIADTEGRNGLPYLSNGDPRTAATVTYLPGQLGLGNDFAPYNVIPLTFPAKYSYSGFGPFVVASGVEARLIEAEAALKGGGGSWLTMLNALRTSGGNLPPDTLPPDTLGVTGCPNGDGSPCGAGLGGGGNTPDFGQPSGGYAPAGYGLVAADTVYPAPAINGDPTYIQNYCNSYSWYVPCYSGDSMVVLHYVRPAGWTAGTGGVANLAPLSDPGTDSARVALLFRERAFWLFLTGHRQGDLRRLLRQYSQWFQRQDQVYPGGAYHGAGTLSYGSDVTAPIPGAESLNPLYHGCLDRHP